MNVRNSCLALMALLLALSGAARAQGDEGLPLQVRLDLLQGQAKAAEQRGDRRGAMAKLAAYRALAPMPWPLLFVDAKISLAVGEPQRALNMIGAVLKQAPRASPLYAQALELYTRADAALPAWKASAREREMAQAALDPAATPYDAVRAGAAYLNAFPAGAQRAAVLRTARLHAAGQPDKGHYWSSYASALHPGAERDYAIGQYLLRAKSVYDFISIMQQAKGMPQAATAERRALALVAADPMPKSATTFLVLAESTASPAARVAAQAHFATAVDRVIAGGGTAEYLPGDALLDAIQIDRIDLVERLIARGKLDPSNVECKASCWIVNEDPRHYSIPLMRALSTENPAAAMKLLDLGADPRGQNFSGSVAEAAVAPGNEIVLLRLIALKAIDAANVTSHGGLRGAPLSVLALQQGASAATMAALASAGQRLPDQVNAGPWDKSVATVRESLEQHVCTEGSAEGVLALMRERRKPVAWLTELGTVTFNAAQAGGIVKDLKTMRMDCLGAQSFLTHRFEDGAIATLLAGARAIDPAAQPKVWAYTEFNGITLLHWEASMGHADNVRALLAAGWSVAEPAADKRSVRDVASGKAIVVIEAAGGQCTPQGCGGEN